MTLIRARIRRSALLHNLDCILARADGSPIWAVLKANAYGHNLNLILPIVLNKVDGLACARLEEAFSIRRLTDAAGAKGFPVLILGGCYTHEALMTAQVQDFQLVVHSFEQLRLLQALVTTPAFIANGKPLKLWFKLNVGMNRLGFSAADFLPVLAQVQALTGVELLGVMAHLGTADVPDHTETASQMKTCVSIFTQVKQLYPQVCTSLSNSAHLFGSTLAPPLTSTSAPLPAYMPDIPYPLHGQSTDWVRPGISMYGASPFMTRSALSLGLKPVMQLEAQVVAVRDLAPGQTAGYGASWTATEPVRQFILACGYGDGYPRHIQNAVAVYKGLSLHQAGRVSMDFTSYYCPLADCSSKLTPVYGDYVEIWGDNTSVDQVARQSGSIGYERLTQLSGRVFYEVVD